MPEALPTHRRRRTLEELVEEQQTWAAYRRDLLACYVIFDHEKGTYLPENFFSWRSGTGVVPRETALDTHRFKHQFSSQPLLIDVLSDPRQISNEGFAGIFRTFRTHVEVSLEAIARDTDFTASTISRIERSKATARPTQRAILLYQIMAAYERWSRTNPVALAELMRSIGEKEKTHFDDKLHAYAICDATSTLQNLLSTESWTDHEQDEAAVIAWSQRSGYLVKDVVLDFQNQFTDEGKRFGDLIFQGISTEQILEQAVKEGRTGSDTQLRAALNDARRLMQMQQEELVLYRRQIATLRQQVATLEDEARLLRTQREGIADQPITEPALQSKA